ncbi:uncharacterized protein [Musca autumnalis]|uniref:uncharacterized protein n=1 Tax=Musca autumnalis TaxID=221902 RepID=UPI003CE822B2
MFCGVYVHKRIVKDSRLGVFVWHIITHLPVSTIEASFMKIVMDNHSSCFYVYGFTQSCSHPRIVNVLNTESKQNIFTWSNSFQPNYSGSHGKTFTFGRFNGRTHQN